jgi:site-specific DNA-methyltransferase (adenine-specific)
MNTTTQPFTLHLGDCLDVLRTLPDNSVDSVVTDPPYALPGGFMGKTWDNFDGREDAGFGYWLAGFTDGEGHFRVQKHERGSHTCVFQIKTRDDDRAVLERIKRFLGVGVIYEGEGSGNANPQCAYIVQDKEGCARVVALFRKYPLTAKKALDFEIWAEAVEEWLERPRGNRWQGMADQARAASLKARLEDVRRYTGIPWSGHNFQDWVRQWATECLRVLKPGGHMLAFGAPRQYHRLAAGIEDAGFEIRDQIMWVFGSGFPKSHNLKGDHAGWGTALKPAHEPICMARKPLIGTVLANVTAFGTGAMNIDACRIQTGDNLNGGAYVDGGRKSVSDSMRQGSGMNAVGSSAGEYVQPSGRWPANLIHDGSPEVVAMFPAEAGASAPVKGSEPTANGFSGSVKFSGLIGRVEGAFHGDSGSAARFFYCAKTSRRDRNEGLVDPGPQFKRGTTLRKVENTDTKGNNHPTVKPTELMAYLLRLVTPVGGTTLDPFLGSGSTGKAAMLEGFEFIGIEKEAPYMAIASARICHAHAAAVAAADLADAVANPVQADLFGLLA